MEYELVIETPMEGMAETSYVRRIGEDGLVSIIPVDPANKDYQAYLETLEETA